MFKIFNVVKHDKNDNVVYISEIHCNRGDKGSVSLKVPIKFDADDNPTEFYKFVNDDRVSLNVKQDFSKSEFLMRKEVIVDETTETITFNLTKEDTSFGELIKKPTNYVYDIVLNDDQTLVGYDEFGARLFILYPESDGE